MRQPAKSEAMATDMRSCAVTLMAAVAALPAGALIGGNVQIELLSDLAPRRLGVRSGTTTERALKTSFPDSDVTSIADHGHGMAAVRNGELTPTSPIVRGPLSCCNRSPMAAASG